MMKNMACKYIYNHYLDQLTGGSFTTDYHVVLTQNRRYRAQNVPGGEEMCGGWNVIDSTSLLSNPYKAVYDKQLQVVSKYIPKFDSAVASVYPCFVNDPNAACVATAIPPQTDRLYQIVQEFQNELDNNAQSAMSRADASVASQQCAQSVASRDPLLAKGGWLAAGVFFNNIVRTEGVRADSMHDAIPQIVAPSLYRAVGKRKNTPDSVSFIEETTVAALGSFSNWLGDGFSPAAQDVSDQKQSLRLPNGSSGASLLDAVFRIVNGIAGFTGVWDSTGTLGIKFDKSRDPFSEVVAFGQNIEKTGWWCLVGAAAVGVVGKVLNWVGNAAALAVEVFSLGSLSWLAALIKGLGDAVDYFAPFIEGTLVFIGIPFIAAGLMLGYMLPLSPFLRFFFGALTWLIAVLEAVVAVPLWALAHVNPEGEGLPGAKGGRGYQLILNIFLRPVLMIFGLIAGYIMFCVVVGFLNTMFIYAALGSGSFAGSLPTFARIVYTLWIIAHANGERLQGRERQLQTHQDGRRELPAVFPAFSHQTALRDQLAASFLCGKNDGLPRRAHRLRALGNAIVPQIAALIGKTLIALERAQDDTTSFPF
jgi:conjugal transfer/type IV secretion protein DotA/TraY